MRSLAGERDSGATGQQNAITTSNSASHLGGFDDHPRLPPGSRGAGTAHSQLHDL